MLQKNKKKQYTFNISHAGALWGRLNGRFSHVALAFGTLIESVRQSSSSVPPDLHQSMRSLLKGQRQISLSFPSVLRLHTAEL